MDEIALNRDMSRAAQAERLMSDEMLKEAFSALEESYVEAWKATTARDTDARERLWQALQIVGKVQAHLQSVAANGVLAKRELAEIAALGERKKVFGVI